IHQHEPRWRLCQAGKARTKRPHFFVHEESFSCIKCADSQGQEPLLVVSGTGEAYYARNIARVRKSGKREHSMKRVFALVVCAFLVGGVGLWAQRGAATGPVDAAAEYQTWMKSNNEAMADLNKNLTAKNAAGAQTDI